MPNRVHIYVLGRCDKPLWRYGFFMNWKRKTFEKANLNAFLWNTFIYQRMTNVHQSTANQNVEMFIKIQHNPYFIPIKSAGLHLANQTFAQDWKFWQEVGFQLHMKVLEDDDTFSLFFPLTIIVVNLHDYPFCLGTTAKRWVQFLTPNDGVN